MICLRKLFAPSLVVALALTLAGVGTVASREPQTLSQPPLPPQEQPPSGGGSGAIIRSNVELVVVPVTVKDASGELVGDLRRDEFRIFEDGVEQRITVFSVEAFPLSAVIAVDDNLKAKSAEQVRKSLISFTGGFSESDEVAVGRFDAFYTPLLDFTTDNDRLLTELKRMDLSNAFSSGSQPFTPSPTINGQPSNPNNVAQVPVRAGMSTKHINDAVYQAATLLRARDPQRRKMVILVSDGTNAPNNTHTYDETLRLLLSTNISVYAVGVDSSVILRGTTLLSKYAHATGGDVYYAARPTELPQFYSRVTEQARHQYTLGYLPTGTDRGKAYHAIEVRIRRPGLTLLTRDGYYTGPKP
jgi:Ca-activated chloride channel family protein